MVKITVFLFRHGETLDEQIANADEDDEESLPTLRLAQKVDPPLTIGGHLQSAVVLTRVLKALAEATPDDEVRRMAAFSAPMRSCTGTAMMMNCAGLQSLNKLRWRYTTVEAAKSPTAIPIIVHNGLCNQVPEINRLGGGKAVVNAGLLHCCAEPFNDARQKCPFMNVVTGEWKDIAQDPIKEWKNEKGADEIRRVLDVQYLRLADPADPWSLQNLTPKINLIVDMVQPKKYNLPPRRGGFEKKIGSNKTLQKELDIGPDIFIKESVMKARQIGCDTVFVFVPAIAIEKIIALSEDVDEEIDDVDEACSMLTVIANVPDETDENDRGENISFKFFTYNTADELMSDPDAAIPDDVFDGQVNVLIEPPSPEQDPDSLPPNQWALFPPPQPEVIPEDYPDLPNFGEALEFMGDEDGEEEEEEDDDDDEDDFVGDDDDDDDDDDDNKSE